MFKLSRGIAMVVAATLAATTIGAVPTAAQDTALTTDKCLTVDSVALSTSLTAVRVSLSVVNGIATLRSQAGLRAAAGLTAPSDQGSAQFGFEASLSDANKALTTLALRAVSAGPVSVTAVVTPAGAAYNADNGHFYEVILGPFTWSAAQTRAAQRTFDGATGYLATVTTASENSFIARVAGVDAWLGATDRVSDGTFVWSGGPEAGTPVSYTNWVNGEPNNFGGKEEFLSIKASGGWNDVGAAGTATDTMAAAVVEFDSTKTAPKTQTWNFNATQGTGKVTETSSCDPTGKPLNVSLVSAGTASTPSEVAITGIPAVTNPYDPAQADVWATVTAPSGKVSKIPAFWTEIYNGATPTGNSQWRVRFKAAESGSHALSISGKVNGTDLAEVTTKLDFNAAALPHITVVGDGFQAGGKPWVPVGYNIAWSTRGSESVLYERWFKAASANGVNMARIWMPSWGVGIEWKDTGLGDYSKRQGNAAALDDIFRIAAKYNVRIVLVFLNHGAFSESTNPEWKDNPYNKANGGPLESPAQFATNAEAVKFWERRLRYIAARWAASPALFSWEWWNEVDFTPIDAADLQTWIKESDKKLKMWDPYVHPTTNSWASAAATRDWSNVDWISIHLYDSKDPVVSLRNIHESVVPVAGGKPILMAELGSSATGEDATLDPSGLHMRNGQWAATFLGFAGPASYWWWDLYVDKQKLWGSTKGLTTLLRGRDLAGMTPTRLSSPQKTIALALQDSQATLVWLRHADLDREARIRLQQAAAIAALKSGRALKPVGLPKFVAKKGQVLTAPVQFTGNISIEFLDPLTGKLLRTVKARAVGNSARVPLIDFTGDTALRITKAVAK